MKKHIGIGEKLSPVLNEIESAIVDFNCFISEHPHLGLKPNYTDSGFRAAIQIFISALMDKMFDLQMKEDIPLESAKAMAFKAGDEIRKLVKIYTNVDTTKFFEN